MSKFLLSLSFTFLFRKSKKLKECRKIGIKRVKIYFASKALDNVSLESKILRINLRLIARLSTFLDKLRRSITIATLRP